MLVAVSSLDSAFLAISIDLRCLRRDCILSWYCDSQGDGCRHLVLPKARRLVGRIEALTGIIMRGLSTGLFFALFNRLWFRPPGEEGKEPCRSD